MEQQESAEHTWPKDTPIDGWTNDELEAFLDYWHESYHSAENTISDCHVAMKESKKNVRLALREWKRRRRLLRTPNAED